MIFEVLRSWPQRHFIGRETQIAHYQFQLWKPAVEQRFPVAEVLQSLRQCVADENDVVPLFEFQLRRVVGSSGPSKSRGGNCPKRDDRKAELRGKNWAQRFH